jgi:hypothetical protein
MLALFWYSPIPHYALPNRDGQPAFFLEGETFEDLAWDLVEQFFEGFMTQDVIHIATPQPVSGPFLMDGADFVPSITKLNRYHEERFSEAWWDRHQWALVEFLGQGRLGEMAIANFREICPPRALLAIYLSVMIGRYYAQFHGFPEAPLDARVAIEWFAANNYLKWLPTQDSQAMSAIMAGDLRVLW